MFGQRIKSRTCVYVVLPILYIIIIIILVFVYDLWRCPKPVELMPRAEGTTGRPD